MEWSDEGQDKKSKRQKQRMPPLIWGVDRYCHIDGTICIFRVLLSFFRSWNSLMLLKLQILMQIAEKLFGNRLPMKCSQCRQWIGLGWRQLNAFCAATVVAAATTTADSSFSVMMRHEHWLNKWYKQLKTTSIQTEKRHPLLVRNPLFLVSYQIKCFHLHNDRVYIIVAIQNQCTAATNTTKENRIKTISNRTCIDSLELLKSSRLQNDPLILPTFFVVLYDNNK